LGGVEDGRLLGAEKEVVMVFDLDCGIKAGDLVDGVEWNRPVRAVQKSVQPLRNVMVFYTVVCISFLTSGHLPVMSAIGDDPVRSKAEAVPPLFRRNPSTKNPPTTTQLPMNDFLQAQKLETTTPGFEPLPDIRMMNRRRRKV
jgi:hypothetical protein